MQTFLIAAFAALVAVVICQEATAPQVGNVAPVPENSESSTPGEGEEVDAKRFGGGFGRGYGGYGGGFNRGYGGGGYGRPGGYGGYGGGGYGGGYGGGGYGGGGYGGGGYGYGR